MTEAATSAKAGTEESEPMAYYRFLVDERPFCIADWHLSRKNTSFLKGIDPTYFKHIANQHAELLDGDECQFAALVLRHAYSQALETFFALLCSAIQAPACPMGWMLKYRGVDLYAVVRKITKYEHVYAKLPVKLTWTDLSDAVHHFKLDDGEKERRIKASYAKAWGHFAYEFLDQNFSDEYNSIKHGLRCRPGGFFVSFGIEPEYGVRAPKENMSVPAGSHFGSSYFVPEQVGDEGFTFRPRSHSRNWNPELVVGRLLLLSMSINNVLSFLRGIGGEEWQSLSFSWPEDLDAFGLPWATAVPFEFSSGDTIVHKSDVPPSTKADVFGEYLALNAL